MNSDLEKKWLVKSDNKVVGPFSTEQLEDLLFKRQVALIDEVRDMGHRWLYIREIPELKVMAEKVRVELDKRSEQTRTVQSPMNTNIRSVSQTAELHISDQTKNIATFTDVNVSTQDIAFKEVQLKTNQTNKISTVAQFASASDPNVKAEVHKDKKRTLIYMSGLFIFALVGIFGFYFVKKSNQEKLEKAMFTKVRKYIIYGADTKAVEVFQKLTVEQQALIMPDILQIFPKLDSEGIINLDESLKTLQKSSNLTALQKSQIEIVQFNKKLNLNNLNDAKGHLIRARDFDPDSEIVKENEAILNYLENQNKESSDQFLNLFTKYNKGRYLFGYTLNHFKKPEMTDVELMEKIERYLLTRIEFKKELVLSQIILALKTNNLAITNGFVNDFTNTPLMLTQAFKTPSLIYAGIYKIDKILPIFVKYKAQLPAKSAGIIELYLSLEKGDVHTAQKAYDQIKSLLSIAEKNNCDIAINSTLNRYSELIAIEKSAAADQLNIASHLALLKTKKENKNPNTQTDLTVLKSEKNLISLWADLIMMNDEAPEKMRSFLQLNSTNAEDFIPYIEAMGRLE